MTTNDFTPKDVGTKSNGTNNGKAPLIRSALYPRKPAVFDSLKTKPIKMLFLQLNTEADEVADWRFTPFFRKNEFISR